MHSTTEVFSKVLRLFDHEDYFKRPYLKILQAFAPGLLDTFLLPGQQCGVYLWRINGEVIYVGQSGGLKWRIAAHLASMLGRVNVMYETMDLANEAGTLTLEVIETERSDLNRLEKQLIIQHSSPAMFNVEHNPNEPRFNGLPENLRLINSVADIHNLKLTQKTGQQLLAIHLTDEAVAKYKARKAFGYLELVDNSKPEKMPVMRCKLCGYKQTLGRAIHHVETSKLHKGLLT